MEIPIGVVEVEAVQEATFVHLEGDIFDSLEFALDDWIVFIEI